MWDDATKTCQKNIEEVCAWFELCDTDKDSPVKVSDLMSTGRKATVHNDDCCALAPDDDTICDDPLGLACCKEENRLPGVDDISWATDSWECTNNYMVEIIFTFGDGTLKYRKEESRSEIIDSDKCCAMCPDDDRFCEACFKETTETPTGVAMWDETTKTCQRNVEEECNWYELCDVDKSSPLKTTMNTRTDVFVTVHNDECCELAPADDTICDDPLGAACCKEENRLPGSDVLSWDTNDNKECENTYTVEIIFTFGDGRQKHTK